MCNHVWNESVMTVYFDRNNQCRTEMRVRTCVFCGKTVKELIRMKDPPKSKRKLPKFIKDDLSSV